MGNITYRSGQIARLRENEKKMGAYYTDKAHCLDIGKMFRFPQEEEVSVLEPSIGDATAVIAVTGADQRKNIKIFGVELDGAVAKKTRANPYVEECIEADFLNGTRIKRDAFSFVFGNPPYMADDISETGEKGRIEKVFLERVTNNYLKREGILVWVIPYRSFYEPASLRYLLNHYEPLAVYRFRPEEYAKWKQIVFIGRKKATSMISADDFKEAASKYELEQLQELPEEPEIMIDVPPSDSKEVTSFTTLEFDTSLALGYLASPDCEKGMEDYRKLCQNLVTQKEYQVLNIGKPPIPPKKDSLYLMSTAGCGQGKAGKEGVDLHLQRGVAEVVEDTVYEENENGEQVAVVTSRTQVTLTVVETNGKITAMG